MASFEGIARRSLLLAPLAAAVSGTSCGAGQSAGGARVDRVEHIPVIWIEPTRTDAPRRLALWLNVGVSSKESSLKELQLLAEAGFVAVSYDGFYRGERADDSPGPVFERLFTNFPDIAWPILGNSAMEALRVIDWAAARFDLEPPFFFGGASMGGDIAVAAAGLDPRIGCVAALLATPDWRRPGMRVGGDLAGEGAPDAYARLLYDRVNPLTNLASYAHRPAITFECGEIDDHVPPDGALRFEAALRETYAQEPDRLRVVLHPGVSHDYVPAMWDNALAWFERHRAGA